MRLARSDRREHTSVPLVRRVRAALQVAVLAGSLVGCLTADGTLERDGTGTLALSYQALPGSTESSQRGILTAPGVTVESLSMSADRTVSATLKVTDLAGIGKTTLLKDTTVTRKQEGDDEVLTITCHTPVRTVEDKTVPGPKVKITVPGKLVEANEKATLDGSTVTWSFSLADWWSRPTRELVARYRPTPGGAAPGGSTTTTAPPAS